MNILVVSGATREYIDGVRFITNFSTGRTGAALARHFCRKHEVFYLHGEGAVTPDCVCGQAVFSSFEDLRRKLKSLVKRRFDMIVFCAAISDYSVEEILYAGKKLSVCKVKKLDSGRPLVLKLKPNPKLIDMLPRWADDKPLIIGFKLTNTESRAHRLKAVRRVSSPVTVHNDMGDIKSGIRRFYVYENGGLTATCDGAANLAGKLQQLGEKHVINA